MKMKKMVYFMFALLIMSATSMKAQVAIGTDPALEPRPGTILDLRHVSGNNMGLLLPKVTLTDAKIWAPVVGQKADEVDGMMVYSDNTSTENGLEGKGVYVWVNGSWNKMKTPPPPPFIQDNPNSVSICYGTTTKFTLAEANGGSGDITYIWEQRATEEDPWVQAVGTSFNQAEYETPALTTNMFYRRTATASVSGGTIESNSAEVTVYPNFTQGNPAAAANVCKGLSTTIVLDPATGGSGGNIEYTWQKSLTGAEGSWENAAIPNNTANYTTPTTLTDNTYFRRKASDAECEPIYSNPTLVTVSLAFTQGNPTPANQTVCYGGTVTFTLAAANGGSGIISHKWQKSLTGAEGSWSDADGTCTNANYTTPALYVDMYFRRVAKCDCGTITSQPAKVEVVSSIGSVTSATSPNRTYTTYTYPDDLGIWTENIKEGTPAKTTYSAKAEGERGYYYTWANAAAACTALGTGWSLPTEDQWDKLITFVNGNSASPCDKSFFMSGDALGGWQSTSSGNWYYWDQRGYWWSSSYNTQYVYSTIVSLTKMNDASYVIASVRCVNVESN